MTKIKKIHNKTIKSKPMKGDILTKMFEHFGIKVIDVNNSSPQRLIAGKKSYKPKHRAS